MYDSEVVYISKSDEVSIWRMYYQRGYSVQFTQTQGLQQDLSPLHFEVYRDPALNPQHKIIFFLQIFFLFKLETINQNHVRMSPVYINFSQHSIFYWTVNPPHLTSPTRLYRDQARQWMSPSVADEWVQVPQNWIRGQKSRIRETKHIPTNTGRSTDTKTSRESQNAAQRKSDRLSKCQKVLTKRHF